MRSFILTVQRAIIPSQSQHPVDKAVISVRRLYELFCAVWYTEILSNHTRSKEQLLQLNCCIKPVRLGVLCIYFSLFLITTVSLF